MTRIVSLLPAATEIVGVLGLADHLVGVSHECDYPNEVNSLPRVTHCPLHQSNFASKEVDEWVRNAMRDNGAIYTIDEPLLRQLQPNIILSQKLCDVCAVGYSTVARMAATLPAPPQVVNLEPSSLSDIFDSIRLVAKVCDQPERANDVIAQLSARVEAVREQASHITSRPKCFLMEWVDPPYCSGHWGPELIEIAGGMDPLGRKHQPSARIPWETVLETQPEIIILALCGYDIDRARRDYEVLRRFPGFDSLPAARNQSIYLVNANAYFARPGPRMVDSLEILAGILHPNEFPEFSNLGETVRIKPRMNTEVAIIRVHLCPLVV